MARKKKEIPIVEVCEFYTNNLVTIKEVAERFGISQVRISKTLEDEGVYKPKNRYGHIFFHLLDESRVESWTHQTKIARELYKSIPNIHFWAQLKMPFNMYSLYYFKSARGKVHLKELYNKFKFQKSGFKQASDKVSLSEEKLTESIPTKKMPKSIHEFINFNK